MGVRSQAHLCYLNIRHPLHQQNWSFQTRLEVSTLALPPQCWFSEANSNLTGFGDVPFDSAATLGSDDNNFQNFYGGDPGSFDGGDKPGRRKASQHFICERTIGERLEDGDHIVPEDSWKFLQSSGSATVSTDEFEQHRSVFDSIPSENCCKA